MSRFKIRMKLQGLELEIDGTREDIPMIAENLGNQLSGLFQPASAIIEGEVANRQKATAAVTFEPQIPAARKSARRRGPATKQAETPRESPVDWKHDSGAYGMPKQKWNTADKATWLLYVVSEAAETPELSGPRISETFNKHFRQAGKILPHNVTRDLGKLKVKPKAGTGSWFGEDTTKTPPQWYLTDAGRKRGQELVVEALGQGNGG